MTRATHYERAQRTAPRANFSGGHSGGLHRETAWNSLVNGDGRQSWVGSLCLFAAIVFVVWGLFA